MSNKIDLTGSKFGRLLIIEQAPSRRDKNGNSCVFWKCKCDCGNVIEKKASLIKTGHSKSCGCLQRETIKKQGHKNFKGEGVAGVNSLFTRYKRGARTRKLEFNLDKESFKNLLFQPCHYCGDLKTQSWRRKEVHGNLLYNGIDRINSLIGYTKENCVTCCSRCNVCKMDYSKEEFFDMVKKVYERHLNEKK